MKFLFSRIKLSMQQYNDNNEYLKRLLQCVFQHEFLLLESTEVRSW